MGFNLPLNGECFFAYNGEWLPFDILGAKVSPPRNKAFHYFLHNYFPTDAISVLILKRLIGCFLDISWPRYIVSFLYISNIDIWCACYIPLYSFFNWILKTKLNARSIILQIFPIECFLDTSWPRYIVSFLYILNIDIWYTCYIRL